MSKLDQYLTHRMPVPTAQMQWDAYVAQQAFEHQQRDQWADKYSKYSRRPVLTFGEKSSYPRTTDIDCDWSRLAN